MGQQLTDLTFFVELKFAVKQIVYLVTDTEQKPRIVKNILLGAGPPQYHLGCGAETSFHEDFEITDKYNINLAEAYGEHLEELDDEDEDDFPR